VRFITSHFYYLLLSTFFPISITPYCKSKVREERIIIGSYYMIVYSELFHSIVKVLYKLPLITLSVYYFDSVIIAQPHMMINLSLPNYICPEFVAIIKVQYLDLVKNLIIFSRGHTMYNLMIVTSKELNSLIENTLFKFGKFIQEFEFIYHVPVLMLLNSMLKYCIILDLMLEK
jgi:hypothetical protein